MDIYKWYWYYCTECGKKLFRFKPGSEVKDIKIWCKNCKEEKTININKRA